MFALTDETVDANNHPSPMNSLTLDVHSVADSDYLQQVALLGEGELYDFLNCPF
jgi:hypothetical protein